MGWLMLINPERVKHLVGAHTAAMSAMKQIQYDPLEPTQVIAVSVTTEVKTAAALGVAQYTN